MILKRFLLVLSKLSFLWEDWALGTIILCFFKTSWYFQIFWDPKSYLIWEIVTQLLYTMFISKNHASFHLCWNQHLVKHQKVSKYYINDCLQNFLLVFLSLLAVVPIVESSHSLARISSISLNKRPKTSF